MKNRSIKINKEQINKFINCALEQKYYLYSVTLTYRQKKYSYNKKRYIFFKLPKQRLAINGDMKKFNDGFTKYCKRRDIKMEYLFLYSRHKKKVRYHKKQNKKCHYPKNRVEQPHFHGIVAVSKKRFLDKPIRKYWGVGNIVMKRLEKTSDIYGWANYIKSNIDNSLNNYEEGKKVISRTMKKCTTYEKIDF